MDDGHSFDFTKGKYDLTEFRFEGGKFSISQKYSGCVSLKFSFLFLLIAILGATNVRILM